MPFQEELYQLRSDTTQTVGFEETPIFIGTASKLIQISSNRDDLSIDIPKIDDGLTLDINKTEVDLTYLKDVGRYQVQSIDFTKKILFVSTFYQNDTIELFKRKYICFILDGNKVILTFSISDATFDAQDPSSKILLSIKLNENIPANIDLILPQYNIAISYQDVLYFDSSSIAQDIMTNTLNILTDVKNLELENLNTILSMNWFLYLNVIDFRLITLYKDDLIPKEFLSNKHSKLGQCLNRHRLLSDKKVTLISIPEESIENIKIALTNVIDNTLGYFIVPLFIDSQLDLILSSWASEMEKEFVWVNIFLSYLSDTYTPLVSFDIQYQQPV